MPFPETPRAIYERNPLTEVICQLRFPTILRIASERPAEFQDRLRDQYPVYRENRGAAPGMPAEISQLLAELPIQVPSEPSYAFEAEDGKRTVNLSREFVAVTERDYRDWESFRGEVERIKTAVEEIYAPPFYDRIGLRYQDVIDREGLDLQGVPWHELVRSPMAGILGGGGDDAVREHVREAVATAELEIPEIPGGTVRLQYGLGTHEGHAEKIYGMDADFYTTERSPTDGVLETLNAFNKHAGNFFRWSITDRLRDALRPRNDAAGDVDGG